MAGPLASSARRRRAAAGVALAAAAVAVAAAAGAEELPLPGALSLLRSDVPLELRGGAIRLRVERRARLELRVSGLRGLHLRYRSDGPFALEYASLAPGSRDPGPRHLLPGARLARGPGRLALDLRATPRWSPASTPVLWLEGGGELAIESLELQRLPPGADPRAEKDRALFWRPERLRHSTVNSLTPVPWSASRGIAWSDACSLALAAASLLLFAASRPARLARGPLGGRGRGLAFPRGFVVLGLATLLVHDLHLAARLAPALHLAPAASHEARLRRYLPSPELGELAATARELLPPGARVVARGEPGDWFAPQVLCFHLAPRACGLAPPPDPPSARGPTAAAGSAQGEALCDGRCPGLSGVGGVTDAEADALISYHAARPAPPGFRVLRSVGPDAFVAVRR